MKELLVVGGGLFGSCAARLARQHGHAVTVFDSGLPGAGSPPAACVFGPNWAGDFAYAYAAGLKTLETLVCVRPILFDTGTTKPRELLRVRPAGLLEPDPVRERVLRVWDGGLETARGTHKGFVYVAAGCWAGELLSKVKVAGRAGAALFFAGTTSARMRLWAPYRQAMAFARDPGETYFSDGTASPKYTNLLHSKTFGRAETLFGLKNPVRSIRGNRPYCEGGLVLERLGNDLAVGVGGRKFGTILGAYCADKLMRWLG